jgi:hypothetical protein
MNDALFLRAFTLLGFVLTLKETAVTISNINIQTYNVITSYTYFVIYLKVISLLFLSFFLLFSFLCSSIPSFIVVPLNY